MKNGKLSTGLIFAMAAAVLFAVCTSQQVTEEKPMDRRPLEKSGPPITFELKKGTSLEKNTTALIERDNNLLHELIVEVRNGLELDEAVWERWMGKTHLRTPILIEDGKKYDNKKDVISRLNIIFKKPNVRIQRNHVVMEYLPYGSEDWWKENPKEDVDRNPKDEIDIIAHIKTTLLHGSNPGNVDLSGETRHRRTCEIW